MSEDKKKEVKKEVLTKEELRLIANIIAQSQTTVQTASQLINLVNKISRIIDQV